MKISIADDEVLVRAGLKSMLEDYDFVEIVGEAANGKDMVEGVRETQPDVVFADIKMPKLNGLEAIKIGKTASPHTKWIILTGFAEFSYAKEALKLGVFNYLLKPVSPEELEKNMKELVIQQQRQMKIINKEFENDMISIFHGLTTLKNLDNDFLKDDIRSIGAVFYLDSYFEEAAKADLFRGFVLDVQSMLTTPIFQDARMALFPLPNGEVTIIGCWKHKKEGVAKKVIKEFLSKVNDRMKVYDESLSITMILSDETASFHLLQESMAEIEKYAPSRTLLGIGGTLTTADFQKTASQLEVCQHMVNLAKYYTERRFLEYSKLLDKLEEHKLIFNNQLQLRENAVHFLNVSLGCQIKPHEHFTAWLKALRTHGEQSLAAYQKKERRPQDIVDHVISYIDHHYMDELGVGSLADELGVTPNYLSTIFRKKTGTTFMKYLTNTRMLKAKELLLEHNAQVKEVAQKVGYYSTRHFSKLFTETVGCYPSEYKNKTSHV
jgi:two-component system, response regulator YesN